MSDTFVKIQQLVIADKIRVSQHAFRRLGSHSILSDDLVAGIGTSIVLEDYPAYHTGPAVLPMAPRFTQCGASRRGRVSRRC